MMLSQSDRRRGFTDEDAPGLAYMRHLARERGISPDALRRHEDRYLESHRNWRSEGDVENFVRGAASELGLEQYQVDMAWNDVATTAERGEFPEVSASAPSPADDQRRLAEIKDILRTDRHRYDRENLGDLAVDIHNRLGAEAGMSVATPVPADAGARDARMGEIKAMMADRHSNYWRSENIQSEYRQLLGGGGEPAGASVAVDAPAGGSAAATGEAT